MVTGTVIFRPSADASLAHSRSGGSNGYSLIAESSRDDDSTYIYQTLSSTSSRTATSRFSMAADESIPDGATITNVTVHIWAAHSDDNGSGQVSGSLAIGGDTVDIASKSLSTSYTEAAASQAVNQPGASALELTISTSGTKESGNKASNGWVRVTQAYVEVTYECADKTGCGVYVKIGSAYTEAAGIYKKQGGKWVLVDKSVCGNKNYICKRGGT